VPPAWTAPGSTQPSDPGSRPFGEPITPTRPGYGTPNRPRAVTGEVVAGSESEWEADEDELHLTLAERIRRLQPAPVILTIGSVGALVFLARAMTSHTTPVPVLLSAGVVSCLVFGVDAGVASIGTWRASRDGLTRRALLLAALGGFAALISAGAFAGVLILVLVLDT
jgi:hypothetical protein